MKQRTAKLATALAGAAVFGAGTVNAAETVEIEPFTVTATRSSTFEEAVAERVVLRMETDEIQAINAVGAPELLERIPGVHVDFDSRSGSVGSLYLRGGDPNFTLVLLNGVKLNDPTNSRGGSFDFATLDPLSIRKVELANGARSAIHGSEAISGVINLATYSPADGEGGSLLLEGGTDSFFRGSFRAQSAHDSGAAYLSADYTDGGDIVESGSFHAKRTGGGAVFGIGDQAEMHVFGYGLDASQHAFPDDSGGFEFADIREMDRREIEAAVAGVNYRWTASDRFRGSVDASIYDREEGRDSPGVAPGLRDPFGIPESTSRDEFTRYELTAFGEYAFENDSSLVFGWSGEREQSQGESELVFFGMPIPGSYELDRDTSSFFMESIIGLSDRFSAQLGARYDEVDGIDGETTLLGGIVLEIPEVASTLQARWGQGFKKPSVFALRNPLVGNPNLVPETSESVDLSWTTRFLDDAGEVSVSVFRYEFENLVDFDPGPPPMLVNRSMVESEGGEVSLSVSPEETVRIGTFLTYADSRDQTTDQRLRSRPSWRGGAFASKSFGDTFRARMDAFYVSDRRESSIPTGDRWLGGYTRVDVRLDWMYSESLDVILSLDNLLDKEYDSAVGFAAPGASARLGIRARF